MFKDLEVEELLKRQRLNRANMQLSMRYLNTPCILTQINKYIWIFVYIYFSLHMNRKLNY